MARTPSTDARALHPCASPQIESRLEARHIEFAFEPNLRVDAIRDVEGNQVRLTEHRAPKDMVDRYAEQMKRGAVFPAIVVNDQHELIDGNTRTAAARRNDRETIAAYVCRGVSALEARSLSVELNQTHGLSMTEAELRAFVRGAVQEGQTLDAKAYARMTGVKAATLARWVGAMHCRVRADREGVTPDVLEDMSDSVLAAINVAKLRSVFVAIASLAADARMPTSQIKLLVTQANAAASEDAALQIVASARDARADDIKTIAGGFRHAKRRSAGAALHIGGLLRFDVADLLDVAPEKQGETYQRLSTLRSRLDGVLNRAQQEWDLDADHDFVEVA
ncbi:MAG TPA: hypothetical protein VFG42_02420 [Baekduia sp.]|uniref:hypothetical protein n=1 Tax=Baekduia sp. TaxID=2600305 RepID=UPI002D78CAA0|nr:hypothetical protein [Baekduia sp.]HET6505621.1 hypothetical protein [Baekduia sp.]